MSVTLKQLSDSQRGTDTPAISVVQASSSDLLRQLESWVGRGWLRAVSYTHLTLPTIYSV